MSIVQRHWDARAAANFMLGGAGAGLVVSSLLLKGPFPLLLGLALVAAGLAAVWLEIGRKLRAVHVFFNPFTSWMTRESFCAALLFILGVLVVVLQKPILMTGAAIAAAAFLYCQARILRAAKGIAAWRVPEVVPLIVTTGLAEGLGIALFFTEDETALVLFGVAVVARLVAWGRYRTAAPSAALEAPGRALAWAGTAAPIALAYFVPSLAGLLALAAGGWLKFALVTRASFKQEFSLPHLPVRGTR